MQALIDRIANIDVDKRIAELEEYIKANKHKGPAKIDKQVKALKVLMGIKGAGVSPMDAFTRETIPVIPSQYRAPIQLPSNVYMVPDVNELLRNIGYMSETIKDIKDDLPPEELEKARKALYDSVSQLQGLEVPEINNVIKKNYYATISGSPGPAKSGYFQSGMTKKRLDLTGRGVISPNPTLDMDQVEIPIDMGLKMYKPFIKKELISRGYDNDKANSLISKKDPVAIAALNRAGEVRPVLINRAPSIDKGSVTAHWPIFVDKYNINIPNVIAQYQRGDFDGDTVSAHVPVSYGSVQEATSMMPSKHLYNDVTGKIRGYPDHSSAVGLYVLSKTEDGRKRINDIIPDQYKISDKLTKPKLVSMLTEMAKEDSPKTADLVDKLTRLGDDYAYTSGFSIGLSDLEPMREMRDKILTQARKEIKAGKTKDSEQLRAIYKKYSDHATTEMHDYFKDKDNPIGDVMASRARGSDSQIRDLLFSPIAVNTKDVISKPIAHSYIEGLTPAEYYAGAAGAREGVKGRAISTAKPGALGKIIFSNANQLVVNKDRGESMGVIRLPLDKPDDLVDRFVAEDVYRGDNRIIEKGTTIDPRAIQIALKNGLSELPVYTPLQSSSADGGIPAMAYGVIKGNKLPEVGFNIGAHAAAGIVSPLYTESMQSFHTGKSLQDRALGFPRLKQVLELTKDISNKATLSSVSGIVDDIRKDSLGGATVRISGKDHYVTPGNDVMVRVGGAIDKGDAISNGPIDPRDVVKYKDLSAAQNLMVEEIVKNTPGSIKRRAAEVVVEAITRYGQIVDPGGSEYLPGDVKLISEIENRNKTLDSKITYEVVMKGVNSLPNASQSWMSQLNFRNIKKVLSSAIAEGKESDIHSYEPAPALAWSAEFGEGEDGKY